MAQNFRMRLLGQHGQRQDPSKTSSDDNFYSFGVSYLVFQMRPYSKRSSFGTRWRPRVCTSNYTCVIARYEWLFSVVCEMEGWIDIYFIKCDKARQWYPLCY